jgi:hypothetical protein
MRFVPLASCLPISTYTCEPEPSAAMAVTLPRRSLTPPNQLFDVCVQALQSWVETPLSMTMPPTALAPLKSQVTPPFRDRFR